MYKITATGQFRKDVKKAKKRGFNINILEKVVDMLAKGQTLPKQYSDHFLTGNYLGYKECHIKPDWILIYKIEKDVLVLTLARTGSHSDLF